MNVMRQRQRQAPWSAGRSPDWLDAQQPLAQWYASGLGESILARLERHLAGSLGDVFGYQGLQIGNLAGERHLLAGAGLHRRLKLDAPAASPGADIHADVLSLPVASGSMKAVLFFHTLDFCAEPHRALREADRVLTDDGQLVIVGFNPFSGFGARHFATLWRRREPWNGRFWSRGRVGDWLSVLDYRVLDSHAMFIRPPFNSERLLRRLHALERLEPWLGGVGGLYVIRARKQSVPMTMLRRQRLVRRAGMAAAALARSGEEGVRPSNVARVDFRKR